MYFYIAPVLLKGDFDDIIIYLERMKNGNICLT